MNQPTSIPGNSPLSSSPVISGSTGPAVPDNATPHEIERAVLHRLQSHPSLRFTRLEVHRCDHDAICLEGFLESNDDDVDLCDVVRGIHGIRTVANHVMTPQPAKPIPPKG